MKSNADCAFSTQQKSTISFTPRELIRYHMEHPDIPITDEHIENLILDFSELTVNKTQAS